MNPCSAGNTGSLKRGKNRRKKGQNKRTPASEPASVSPASSTENVMQHGPPQQQGAARASRSPGSNSVQDQQYGCVSTRKSRTTASKECDAGDIAGAANEESVAKREADNVNRAVKEPYTKNLAPAAVGLRTGVQHNLPAAPRRRSFEKSQMFLDGLRGKEVKYPISEMQELVEDLSDMKVTDNKKPGNDVDPHKQSNDFENNEITDYFITGITPAEFFSNCEGPMKEKTGKLQEITKTESSAPKTALCSEIFGLFNRVMSQATGQDNSFQRCNKEDIESMDAAMKHSELKLDFHSEMQPRGSPTKTTIPEPCHVNTETVKGSTAQTLKNDEEGPIKKNELEINTGTADSTKIEKESITKSGRASVTKSGRESVTKNERESTTKSERESITKTERESVSKKIVDCINIKEHERKLKTKESGIKPALQDTIGDTNHGTIDGIAEIITTINKYENTSKKSEGGLNNKTEKSTTQSTEQGIVTNTENNAVKIAEQVIIKKTKENLSFKTLPEAFKSGTGADTFKNPLNTDLEASKTEPEDLKSSANSDTFNKANSFNAESAVFKTQPEVLTTETNNYMIKSKVSKTVPDSIKSGADSDTFETKANPFNIESAASKAQLEASKTHPEFYKPEPEATETEPEVSKTEPEAFKSHADGDTFNTKANNKTQTKSFNSQPEVSKNHPKPPNTVPEGFKAGTDAVKANNSNTKNSKADTFKTEAHTIKADDGKSNIEADADAGSIPKIKVLKADKETLMTEDSIDIISVKTEVAQQDSIKANSKHVVKDSESKVFKQSSLLREPNRFKPTETLHETLMQEIHAKKLKLPIGGATAGVVKDPLETSPETLVVKLIHMMSADDKENKFVEALPLLTDLLKVVKKD